MSAYPTRDDLRLAEADAPRVHWNELWAHLRQDFLQGDHVTILGPTGTGKTHIALELAGLRRYVMLVACKPADPLIDDAVSKGYYLIPGNRLEIPHVDDLPQEERVIYWPRMPRGIRERLQTHELLAAERRMQKPLVGGAIGYVRDKGKWCLVLDEGTWICRDLGLQRDVDSALTQFRTLKASVMTLGQRPSWMGRYVMAMPQHLILFQTPNRDDLKALGDISGTDTKLVQHLVRGLDREAHEFLYIGTRSYRMFRSVAPPR